MHKSKLQELCQKKSWKIPVYESVKDGPDHQPHFTATVTVNDVTFESSPVQCRSSKEAQNVAAQVAFNHFSSLNSAPQQTGFAISRLKKHDSPVKAYSQPGSSSCSALNSAPQQTSFAISRLEKHDSSVKAYSQPGSSSCSALNSAPQQTSFAISRLEKHDSSGQKNQSSHFSVGETSDASSFNLQPVPFESMSLHLTKEDEISDKFLLQEHAQRKGLHFPTYDTTRSGPSHMPIFVSNVKIRDESYQGQEAKTKKMAEMNAAKAAYLYLTKCQKTQSSNFSVGETSDASSFNLQPVPFESMSLHLTQEDKILYKSLLQEHAQRKGLHFPTYDTTRCGPSHMPIFVSTVKIGGESYQGQEAKTKKMAEMNAAKTAYLCLTKCQKTQSSNFSVGETSDASSFNLQPVPFESMSLHLTQEDKILYKSLLQEHAQRKGLHFPTYDTTRCGPSHMPIFISTVKIGGESYQGQEAKTKKMAEMNAAKAAYICLTKCQKTQSSSFSVGETSDASSFNLQPDASGKVREDVARSSSISIKEQAQEIQGQKTQSSNPSVDYISDASSFHLQPDVTGKVKEDVARNSSISIKEQAQEIQDNNGKWQRSSTTYEDAHAREQGSSTAKSPPQYPKDIASLPTLNIVIPPAQTSVKRTLICPRTPDMIIPEGAIMLPSSDDQWAAMAMTVPEEE